MIGLKSINNVVESLEVGFLETGVFLLIVLSLSMIGIANVFVIRGASSKACSTDSEVVVDLQVDQKLLAVLKVLALRFKLFLGLCQHVVALLFLVKHDGMTSIVGKGLGPEHVAGILDANSVVGVGSSGEGTNDLLNLLLVVGDGVEGEARDVGTAELVNKLVVIPKVKLDINIVSGLIVAEDGDKALEALNKRVVAVGLEVFEELRVGGCVKLVEDAVELALGGRDLGFKGLKRASPGGDPL